VVFAMILMTSHRARHEPLEVREERWSSRQPTATLTDRTGRHDRYSVELPMPSSSFAEGTPSLLERARDALLRYDIYAPRRMRSAVCSPDGRVCVGALIIQRVCVGPIAVETAVRVVDVFEASEMRRVGFTYVTLQGHVEKGVASFLVARHDDAAGQRLTFNIESWSTSARGMAQAIAPLSRLVQKAISREALEHFRTSVSGGDQLVRRPAVL
jgi:uncharacterized protein (UPF0548 family)